MKEGFPPSSLKGSIDQMNYGQRSGMLLACHQCDPDSNPAKEYVTGYGGRLSVCVGFLTRPYTWIFLRVLRFPPTSMTTILRDSRHRE